MRIYLAGPLFTTAEREFNDALAVSLRTAGHEVFLPQEQEQRETTSRTIFITANATPSRSGARGSTGRERRLTDARALLAGGLPERPATDYLRRRAAPRG
jgi:hypothetical protein